MTRVPEGSERNRLRYSAQRGIATGRLELNDWLPYACYWEVLGRVDIASDLFPYNGKTTTCDTLWRGIPLVSLTGGTSVVRSGYGLLKAVGLEELAVPDRAAYVCTAVDLARDGARLRQMRAGLRALRGLTPARRAGFARELETAYRVILGEWFKTGAP